MAEPTEAECSRRGDCPPLVHLLQSDAFHADLPAQWENDATIAAEVERRFEAFKAGRERGLSHDDVFAAAEALVA